MYIFTAPTKALGSSMRGQIDGAAVSTSRAFMQQNRGDGDGAAGQTVLVDDMAGEKGKESDDKKMSQEIMVMEPILRFLQLLCENHNLELQVRKVIN